jgi:DNA-binding transcriptional ArsR family regulator
MVEAEVFKALADPTRRAVFECLSRGEMNVTELKAGFNVSQPAISQHLSALKGAGLVSERREGRHSYYRCDPSGLEPLADWLQRYKVAWPERLEKLKHVLKDMDP